MICPFSCLQKGLRLEYPREDPAMRCSELGVGVAVEIARNKIAQSFSVEAASQVIPPRRSPLQPWSIYDEILIERSRERRVQVRTGTKCSRNVRLGGGGEGPLAPAYEGNRG
jgi:hypothetical protein